MSKGCKSALKSDSPRFQKYGEGGNNKIPRLL